MILWNLCQRVKILYILILRKNWVREKYLKAMTSALTVHQVEKVWLMLKMYVENAQNHQQKSLVIKRYRRNLMTMMKNKSNLIWSIEN